MPVGINRSINFQLFYSFLFIYLFIFSAPFLPSIVHSDQKYISNINKYLFLLFAFFLLHQNLIYSNFYNKLKSILFTRFGIFGASVLLVLSLFFCTFCVWNLDVCVCFALYIYIYVFLILSASVHTHFQ